MAVTHKGKDARALLLPPVRPPERYLIFGSPQIQQAEIDEVVASMRSGWLGTGPKVARFEERFAAYRRASHAVAVSSCTAAMHLSLIAGGISTGAEVITAALTFAATVNVIIHVGATPVIVDVDPRTMNMDPGAVERAITTRTRAIIPVHFAGRPVAMDRIIDIATRHDVKVIEDCAHAIETEYRGQPAGTFGDFGCFSFYATKNLTTGEGGMVLTRDAEDAEAVRIQSLHGLSRDAWKRFSDSGWEHYQVVAPGFKYNMMDIQAAIGLHQLDRIDTNWQRRRDVWDRYQSAFAGTGLILPLEPEPDTRHAYHLYSVLVEESRVGISRDGFLAAMKAQGIGVGVHYMSIPEHPYYQQTYGWSPDDHPNARDIGRSTVSLPLSARLTDEESADVVEAVHRILAA